MWTCVNLVLTGTRMSWRRPESVPYPSVWAECRGRKAMPDGRVPNFRIQDATEEMFEELITHMNTFYLKDEPMAASTKLSEDPVSVKEFDDVWLAALKGRAVLVALEVLEDGRTKLAGVNMTLVDEKNKKNVKFHGIPMRTANDLVVSMSKKVNLYEKYGVDFYLSAMGLSVSPEYRGQGLGLEMLKARDPLCKALGLTLTSTVFSAYISQELARRAGFELTCEVEYSSFKVDGKESFPGLSGKTCKAMSKKIE